MSNDTLVSALAKAQVTLKNATLDSVSENSHYKHRYASLTAIRDAVVPVLAEQGIATIQAIETREYGPVVVTKLLKNKDEIVSECPVIVGDRVTAQQFGSALTYARRYSLASIVGVASEEDDDANAANESGSGGKPKKAAPKQDDPMRTEYTRIKDGISKCVNAENLNAFWEAEKENTEKIKAHTQAGFDGLNDAYTTKLDGFNMTEAAE